MEPDIIIPIATTASGAGVVFSREERERHLYIVGKSGSGKSTFLFNLAMGDILAGEGVAVIDPHGDLALDILDAIPRSRINDVCYLDAADSERPVGFNPATRPSAGRSPPPALSPRSSTCGRNHGGSVWSTFSFTVSRRSYRDSARP